MLVFFNYDCNDCILQVMMIGGGRECRKTDDGYRLKEWELLL
jgi:hypothetical protein